MDFGPFWSFGDGNPQLLGLWGIVRDSKAVDLGLSIVLGGSNFQIFGLFRGVS